MSRACDELPDKRGRFSAPSSSHLVICRDFLLAARAEPAALPAMGATTIIGYRGSRQEADDVDALARSCACTRAAYMRYAGRYLAAAVRLEVIAREEVRRGNLTSEQVDL